MRNKRVNITIDEETVEALRLLAFNNYSTITTVAGEIVKEVVRDREMLIKLGLLRNRVYRE